MNKKTLLNIQRKWTNWRLEEDILNEDTSKSLADIFTRFLIGDRKGAIAQLTKLIDKDFATFDMNSKNYNKQFDKLYTKIHTAIKSVIK